MRPVRSDLTDLGLDNSFLPPLSGEGAFANILPSPPFFTLFRDGAINKSLIMAMENFILLNLI